MPYCDFNLEDFCKDPDFIRWVQTPTDETNRFWRSFMAEYPHKVADIQRATEFVRLIQFQEIIPSSQDLARLKQRIFSDVEQPERDLAARSAKADPERRMEPVRVIQWYQRPYWAAAAMVVLIMLAGLGWYGYKANASLTYQTAYGKIQEIKLADGSVVTLNANSSLKVDDDLIDSPVREVWLAGEAYFDIARRNGTRFVVHTPEATIEVLGTEFNVNTRREQTNVVLHEGKVQLQADNQSAVVMKPGDMAIVSPKSRHIELKKVQPDLYDSWKEAFIVLDGRTVSEIIHSLEDTFGVTINLTNAQLADKKLTGKLRTDVADDCIENLAIILEADVSKKGDAYSFE